MQTAPIGARRHYAGYRWRAAGLVVFFVSYVAIALMGYRFSQYGEYYPVFSWSLFSRVYADQAQWELVVRRVGERDFNPPVPYHTLRGDFNLARSRDSGAIKAAKRLVRALVSAPQDVAAQKAMFERQVLDGISGVDYEIRYVRFRPLDRWHEGTIIGFDSYGRFTSGEKP